MDFAVPEEIEMLRQTLRRFVTDEVITDGSLVVDIGRIISPTGQSKYVVVYQRQADGSLRIAVDAANSDGPAASVD